MMPNFSIGDDIFDNGCDCSKGNVTGPGKMDRGLFFDDRDLAPDIFIAGRGWLGDGGCGFNRKIL